MKSYALRAGSNYTLVEEEGKNVVFFPAWTGEDILFEEKELIEVDTVGKMLHFKRGHRHYYASVNAVSVIH